MIELIIVPYDSGHRSARLGRGPDMLHAGLTDRLRKRGHEVVTRTVETRVPFAAEGAVAFDVARGVAEHVRSARAANRFPLVLAGNCMSAVGVAAGLGGGEGLAVAWFDAHADFNTPETSVSAFLDGMAVSVLTGRCWTAAAATVPGFRPVQEAACILLGVRDLDDAERRLLDESAVTIIGPPRLGDTSAVEVAVDGLPSAARAVYVHLDLDVLDPTSVGPANSFAAPSGLSASQVSRALRVIAARRDLAALTVSAYDPAVDTSDTVREAALALVADVLDARRTGARVPNGPIPNG